MLRSPQDCPVDRCRAPPLSTNLVLVRTEEEKTMSNYSNPALEAELAYRRELLRAAGARTRVRRWSRRSRPSL